MTPTPRTAAILAALALAGFVVPLPLAALAAAALLAAAAVDARAARRAPEVERALPAVLARGVPVPLRITAGASPSVRVRLRQAVPPGMALEPAEADGELDGRLVPRLRGRHELPSVGTRTTGPLGLAAWHHDAGEAGGPVSVSVYPDLLAARRLALSVRQGRFRDQGISARGPLGLGTEFELVRDYVPDDDVRQVNWRATARLGRPMSNQYRTEQDRDVIAVVDAGRLSAAPLPESGGVRLTVLDACLDALTALALVADEAGDRFGAIAFDDEIRFAARPGRARGAAVVRSLFDVQPRPVESDYELAFRRVEGSKRAFVLVLCDLLEESAARPLVEAMPVLARRHAVVVAGPADPGLEALATTAPDTEGALARTAVALEVRAARTRAAALVRRAGAQVLEAPADRLPSACVAAYLRAKQRAQL
jgi:uncharacterized protein (DUF58 family)